MADVVKVDRASISRATGQGVRVLVVDSGVDVTHEALRGRTIATWRVEEDGCSVVRDSGEDAFGHGTAVAAIISDLAPSAAIDSLRVLGGDLRTSSDRVVAGLRWAIEQRYGVVNCSFGTPSSRLLGAYKEIVDAAFCANTLLVAAANNFDPQRTEYPSAFPTVLSTSFVAADNPFHLERRPGQIVEFGARGERVRVAWKRGRWLVSSGSSFAAPHLAAMAARIRELAPSWNACEVKAALYQLCASV